MSQVERIYFQTPVRLPDGRFWRWARRQVAHPVFGGVKRFVRQGMAASRPTPYLLHRYRPAIAPPPMDGGLTVISANLWHDWPRHRKLVERLEAFAQMVEQEAADVLLLQEVARTSSFEVNEWLAGRLGMAYVYGRANGFSEGHGFEEGVAIFSRYPLADPLLRPLAPSPWPFVHRVALSARVLTERGRLRLFSVHLGQWPAENRAQIGDLEAWVASVSGEEPAIVGGDFNAPDSTRRMARLRQKWHDALGHKNGQPEAATHIISAPWGSPLLRMRLDYLFFRPGKQTWRVEQARLLDAPELSHSDHRAVLARLVF